MIYTGDFNSNMRNFLRIFVNPYTPLGRWRLVETNAADMRADRANEDHCGTCGWSQINGPKPHNNENIYPYYNDTRISKRPRRPENQ